MRSRIMRSLSVAALAGLALVGCATATISRAEVAEATVYVVPMFQEGTAVPVDIYYVDRSTYVGFDPAWQDDTAQALGARGIVLGEREALDYVESNKAGEIPAAVVEQFHNDVLARVSEVLGVRAEWWPEDWYSGTRPNLGGAPYDYAIQIFFTGLPEVGISAPFIDDGSYDVEVNVQHGSVFMWLYQEGRVIARNGVFGYDMRGDADWWETEVQIGQFDAASAEAVDVIVSSWEALGGVPAVDALFADVEIID